jgi:acetoin utilization deacetylase AcuC-like enzyme
VLDVIFDPRYAHHVTGPGHPERAGRLDAIVEGLEAGGSSKTDFLVPAPAAPSRIAAVHDARYVAIVERTCAAVAGQAGSLTELPTGDTIVTAESFDIAMLAAGGALLALDRARAGRTSLAIVRPPGHHAEPARGMGFCVFNNIAIAAQAARQDRGPVLIVDFDYHHGNGTQTWVEKAMGDGHAALGFISTHAYPAYPGTGSFAESFVRDDGFVIDVPLPHSTSTDDFIAVWSSLLPPLARRLRPSVILVSAGFDFLSGDPIAGLPVAPRAVDALCGLLGSVADEHRAALALILEGGYSLDNLRASGSSLARDFGARSGDVHVPGGATPTDARLHGMVDEVVGWL